MSKHAARFLYPLAGTLIIILAWHYYVVLFHVPVVVLPTPMQVLQAMVKEWKVLIEEGWITALECIYGFALAMAIGVPIAVIMTYSRIANQMFYPLLVASQSIPKVAVAPILLVWFGTGILAGLGKSRTFLRQCVTRFGGKEVRVGLFQILPGIGQEEDGWAFQGGDRGLRGGNFH